MNRSKEIADVMKNFYDRWSAGDSSFIDDLLTSQNEIVVVGTDPDEWWQGRDTVYKARSTQFKEMGRVTIKPGGSLRMPLAIRDGQSTTLRFACPMGRGRRFA